ncbi:MAG: MFS transporter [Spirochaetaceae bacterium]|jgi:UMF1 family MFS transporter|nr:MFS transporter [Spirochaetaceae bacterium]
MKKTSGSLTNDVTKNGVTNALTVREKSWIMYDWANSVYATIMMAAIFPVYFTGLVNRTGAAGDAWWSAGTAIAMVITAVLSPIAGAIADYAGYKKKLFVFFLALGAGATLLCAAFGTWQLMLVCTILSRIGFSASVMLYDSFLPDVTTPERMDRVSGLGFAFGYIGGSTIPFVASIALIQFGPRIGVNGDAAVKIALLLTALWWLAFSIPFLKNVTQIHSVAKPEREIVKKTFSAIAAAAVKIFRHKPLFFFIIAYFFYIDGVGTIINMSTSYGETLGINTVGMITALLVTQLIAFPCAILFARLSGRFGSLRMLFCAVCVYLGISGVGFIMGFGLETTLFDKNTALVLFWVLAVLVGMVQGGIQAVSRSHFAKLVPPENAGEFFGFFDIFGKFASVMGPTLYAVVKTVTGRSSFAILSITLLFIIALAVFAAKGKTMTINK